MHKTKISNTINILQFGCTRSNCEYLHDATVNTKSTMEGYKCVVCMNTWNDKTCIKEHVIKNIRTFFCLNCDDWILEKDKVYEQGGSLLDKEGYLRKGI